MWVLFINLQNWHTTKLLGVLFFLDLWDHWRKRGARIDVGQTIIGVSLKSNMIVVVIVTLELKCYFLVGERAESQPMCQTVQQIKIMCVRSCGSQIEAENSRN